MGYSEELFFRRVLVQKLESVNNLRIVGQALFNATVFSSAHILSTDIQGRELIIKLVAMGMVGIVYYSFYYVTRSLKKTAIVHAGYNIIINYSHYYSSTFQIAYFSIISILGALELYILWHCHLKTVCDGKNTIE